MILESVLVCSVLALMSAAFLEIARLLAFKAILQVAAFETATQISHAGLLLQREGMLARTADRDQSLHLSLSEAQTHRLQLSARTFVEETLFHGARDPSGRQDSLTRKSFDLRLYVSLLEHNNQTHVKVHINACLTPLLLPIEVAAAQFRDDGRNCLGQWRHSTFALAWPLKIVVSVPFSHAGTLFEKGMATPQEFYGLEVIPGEGPWGSEKHHDNSLLRVFKRLPVTDLRPFLLAPHSLSATRGLP